MGDELSSHSNDGRIATEKSGHIFLIDIDRPKKLNGFNVKIFRQVFGDLIEFEPGGEVSAFGTKHAMPDRQRRPRPTDSICGTMKQRSKFPELSRRLKAGRHRSRT